MAPKEILTAAIDKYLDGDIDILFSKQVILLRSEKMIARLKQIL